MFQNSFTAKLRTTFYTKTLLHIQLHPNDDAVLPSETVMGRKSYKFENTVPKDVALKYTATSLYRSFSGPSKLSVITKQAL